MIDWLGFGKGDLIFKVTAGLKLSNLSNNVLDLQNRCWEHVFSENGMETHCFLVGKETHCFLM